MAERVESITTLSPCKRYIATHDANGKSVYTESPPQQYAPVPNVGGVARSYSVSSVPAKLTGDEDMKAYLSKEGLTSWTQPAIVTPMGANLLVVDLASGGVSMMHRTVSIDFSICTNGEIDHELDGGQKVRLRPGVSASCGQMSGARLNTYSDQDHIVQRGTMHRWSNASQTEPARFVAVTLSCEPFDIAGQQLEEQWR